jgi:N-acyl-D-aspartate/D-glutamate deacylase
MTQFDTLIRSGTIIDGLRSGRYVGVKGISDGKIVAIGGSVDGATGRQ